MTASGRELRACGMSAIQALTCDNESGPGGVGSTSRGLTHLSDSAGRGLGVSLPIEQRLWSRVIKTEAGCWEWTGHRTPKGYGTIREKGSTKRAHRLAWELANDSLVPDGLVVMHACDNPPCINPDHLSVGTHADNAHDRDQKGRAAVERKTHCQQGHPWTEENIRTKPCGERVCRVCDRRLHERQGPCPQCGVVVRIKHLPRHTRRWHAAGRVAVGEQS